MRPLLAARIIRAWRLTSVILSVAALAFDARAAEKRNASPIPLDKGTRWVYEAQAKWTPAAGDGLAGTQSARIRWTAEVVSCVQSNSVCAAVVHAFPMELLGMAPAKPKGYTVLVENPEEPKRKEGMTREEIAKMEQEMEALEQHDLKAVEECYGENMLTRQLRHQLRAAPDAPARPRAAARAKRPKAILRRDQAQHERAHPLLRPATSQLVRDRMARTGRHINPDLRLWTDREDNLLGTGRDEQIARDASGDRVGSEGAEGYRCTG